MIAEGPDDRTVLVVDDHEMVRAALVVALREHGIAAHACSGRTIHEILAEATTHPAGIVLLDLDLGTGPDGEPIDGVDAIPALRRARWSVLVVSGGTGPRLRRVAAAIAAGAAGQVPKSASFASLVEAVLEYMAGRRVMTDVERGSWLDLDRAERAESHRRAVLLSRLTSRERSVLEMLADGRRAAEIAAASVVSVATVRSQIRAILAKLEVSSQLGAVAVLRAHQES